MELLYDKAEMYDESHFTLRSISEINKQSPAIESVMEPHMAMD